MSTISVGARPAGRVSPPVTAATVLLGVLALAMSIAGTAVAVPRIGDDLGVSGAALQWVVAGYNLTFAACTLVCGSLADLFGRRRVFTLGAALFTVAALAGTVANGIWLLDAARLLAGVGAAGMMAAGGAILASTFDGAARTRAFAGMGTMAGVGIAIGPSLSGWMIGGFGWRGTFGAYVVAGLLVLAGSRFAPESRAGERPRVDHGGITTFVGGLAALMFGIMQGPEQGWSAAPVLVALAVGALLLVAFGVVERRGAHPVLDLTLIRNRPFMGWCLGTLATSIGFVGVLVFLPTYLQGVNGVPASESGVLMLMLTAPVLVVPPLGGRLVTRGVPGRTLMTAALGLIAAGNAWLTVLRPGIGVAGLLGPLLLIGVGMGLSFGITDGQAMNIVEPTRAGTAAGFLNTVRGAAEALVIAVFGAALVSLIRVETGSPAAAARIAAGEVARTERTAFTDAWHSALSGVTLVTALCAVAVFVLLRPRRSSVDDALEGRGRR
ncbi:MFS transporter [Actinoallomurus iriomotensis]|uniref:MFS transporter n=1 Tax=Actinoallomurus iriomotensis TaxID=478107 RepID=A0A9W6VSU2_9ACTN|nr:MFS transporter [Actinoallomurus iriomotensis]GLY77872.1 MFS transporter [Actinoallomurus iriomotensis]